MKIKHTLTFFIFSIIATSLFAQFKRDTSTIENCNTFGIETANGSSIYIDATKVVSISMQKYTNGEQVIFEIDIDTGSDALVRLYHAQTLKEALVEKSEKLPNAQQISTKAQSISDAANASIPDDVKKLKPEKLVYKSYPTTTHAKTIELIIDSQESILSLYQLLTEDMYKFDSAQLSDYCQRFKENNLNKLLSAQGIGGKRTIILPENSLDSVREQAAFYIRMPKNLLGGNLYKEEVKLTLF